MAAAWTTVYRDTAQHWDLYELAEKLVDLEDYFRQWRFRHVTTVQRIIGLKPGTGETQLYRIDTTTYELEPGDSIHFRTVRPHAWANPDSSPARAVWLSTRGS